MSDSDRMHRKKMAVQLSTHTFKPVLDSGERTQFRAFGRTNANSLRNTKFDPNCLNKTDTKISEYYGIPMNNVLTTGGTPKCQPWICEPATEWPNRVPLGSIYAQSTPQRYFYWEKFTVCFGSLQGASTTSLPNNRNVVKTGGNQPRLKDPYLCLYQQRTGTR